MASANRANRLAAPPGDMCREDGETRGANMRRLVLLVVSMVAYACGGSSNTSTFSATMSSANEPTTNFPAGARPASNPTGTATIQIAGNVLTYSLRATALSGPATNAHIHLKNAADPASN